MSSEGITLPELPDLETMLSGIDAKRLPRCRGRVAALVGNSIRVSGLAAPLGAVCRIHSSYGETLTAKVIGFEGTSPILSPIDPIHGLAAGDVVELAAGELLFGVGDALRGRVLDGLGRVIDGGPPPLGLTSVSMAAAATAALDRPPIDQPLETGVRAIDSLLTCGIGQRLGIFAGSGVGKSTLMGMLARQSRADVVVVGMIGERGREVNDFLENNLGPEGRKRSVVVVASSDATAAMRAQAAWTCTAIAEAYCAAGKHVLLLMDSVTRFALAMRELGLAAGEPPTTRGYTPSVFAELPRLFERVGRTRQGAITAFYTVLVEGDDPNEPLSDAVRGMLDGHILLSRRLATSGHWPAIDVLESLSRLQPHLVDQKHQQSATRLRSLLASYRENSDLISLGAYRSGSNPTVDAAIQMKDVIDAFLQQGVGQPSPLATTVSQLHSLASK